MLIDWMLGAEGFPSIEINPCATGHYDAKDLREVVGGVREALRQLCRPRRVAGR